MCAKPIQNCNHVESHFATSAPGLAMDQFCREAIRPRQTMWAHRHLGIVAIVWYRSQLRRRHLLEPYQVWRIFRVVSIKPPLFCSNFGTPPLYVFWTKSNHISVGFFAMCAKLVLISNWRQNLQKDPPIRRTWHYWLFSPIKNRNRPTKIFIKNCTQTLERCNSSTHTRCNSSADSCPSTPLSTGKLKLYPNASYYPSSSSMVRFWPARTWQSKDGPLTPSVNSSFRASVVSKVIHH